VRERVPETTERIAKGIRLAHKAGYKFEYRRGSSPVANDEEITATVREAARWSLGRGHRRAARNHEEDFSAYQKVRPGSCLLVSARNELKRTITHPNFDIDEGALENGFSPLQVRCSDCSIERREIDAMNPISVPLPLPWRCP
jgi:amidohydrolase